MPLASWASLHFYGPGTGAMVVVAQAQTTADIAATARARSTITATASVPRAKATRLVGQPAVITGTGSMPRALPKARARASMVVRVNTLSQDDVTGAVLEAKVEGTYSLKEVLRFLMAHAAGDATGLDGSNIAFKAPDGTTRIAGTVVSGTRTITTRNGS